MLKSHNPLEELETIPPTTEKEDPTNNGGSGIHISFNPETLVVMMAAVMAILARSLKSFLAKELRRTKEVTNVIGDILIRDALVTILAISRSKSVTLLKLHNGVLDERGFHLLRISLMEEVTTPDGRTEWTYDRKKVVDVRDAPVDMQSMITEGGSEGWLNYDYDVEVPYGKHLRDTRKDEGNKYQARRVVFAGLTPIGVLVLTFPTLEVKERFFSDSTDLSAVEALYGNVSEMMVRGLTRREKNGIERGIMSFLANEVERK
jgi:hypothetical protein